MEEEAKKSRKEIEEVEGRLQASVVAEVRKSIDFWQGLSWKSARL